MGLYITQLQLTNFRSFINKEFVLAPGLTVLVGPNAVGKTNTIEALELITSGKSFRNPRPSELVRAGTEAASITSHLVGDGRVLDIACQLSQRKKSFFINSKRCYSKDLIGLLPSILFCPDDLVFAKGSASWRRQEIDSFGSQVSPGYSRVLNAYTKAVSQRNALLKQEEPDLTLLDAWDESLATGAGALLFSRIKLVERLSEKAAQIYKVVSGGEELYAQYYSTIGAAREHTKQEISELMYTKLKETQVQDLRRQLTSAGPHHDDIQFFIQNQDARTFCSQGQQRSIVLAWKMAEVLLIEELLGCKPLLLLDDVMSELDSSRRDAMVEFIQGGIQTLITTTNLGYFSDKLISSAKVLEFRYDS